MTEPTPDPVDLLLEAMDRSERSMDELEEAVRSLEAVLRRGMDGLKVRLDRLEATAAQAQQSLRRTRD